MRANRTLRDPFTCLITCLLSAVMGGLALGGEDGLVAHYSFDEGSGTVARDLSGNGNNGEIHGANYIRCGPGFALTLDGIDDYVDCGNDAKWRIANAVTVEAWIKPAAAVNRKATDAGVVLKQGYLYGLTYDMRKDHAINFYVNTPFGNYLAAPVKPDIWQHIVGTFDGRMMKLYIDGELKASKSSESARIQSSPNNILVGRNAEQYFQGMIDGVRIYNRAVTSGDILAHYRLQAKDKGKELSWFRGIKLTPRLRFVHREITIDLDFKGLWPLPPEGLSAEVQLTRPGKTVIDKRNIAVSGKSVHEEVTFSASNLEAGDYEVRAIARNEKGNTVADISTATLSWPERPKWLGSKEGITQRVLRPWTPVKIKTSGDTLAIGTWGRSYEFSNLPFPTRIETKDCSILARPVGITAKVDGRAVNWQAGSTKLETTTPTEVSFSQTASDGLLTLSARTRIEYDGMARIDWKIRSARRGKLDELTLEICVPAKHAKYLYQYPGPWGGRVLRNARALPPAGYVYGFIPFLWLGDEERGLAWFCESDKNWFSNRPEEVTKITRDGDNVVIRLSIVNAPVEMSPGKELSYTFGLQATPVKPVVKDLWDFRISTPVNYGSDYDALRNKIGPKLELDYLADLGVKTLFITNWTDILCSTSPVGRSDELRKLVESCHERGIQVLVYIGYQISENNPEWPAFHQEVRRSPVDRRRDSYPGQEKKQTMDIICFQSVWQDYLVDGIARLIDEYDIDGVYIDTLFLSCNNTSHGCGYVAQDGRMVKTYPIFAFRETFKRIYTSVKTRKPEGQVDVHNSTCMVIPALAWATSYYDGEHLYVYKPKAKHVMDMIPLDMFRTEFMGHQWGVPADFLSYEHLVGEYRTSFAFTLLHDVLARACYNRGRTEFISQLWHISDRFGRKGAEWLPYWKNANYVRTSPKDTYASLYRHPKNGVLAVVSNLQRQNARLVVQLNIETLDLKNTGLSARNALTGESVRIKDGRIELSLPPMGWKVLWIRRSL